MAGAGFEAATVAVAWLLVLFGSDVVDVMTAVLLMLASVNMNRTPPSSDADKPCSKPPIASSGQSPPPEAKSELIAALNVSASSVTVNGPMNGSLNGASTYCDGSSSVPRRLFTI